MIKYIYIVAPICGWLAAQLIKFIISLRKDKLTIYDFVQSGGMPSSHSAFMVSLLTVIGYLNGIYSAIFGLCFAITAIIIYDAVGVRRTTGEQTAAINEIVKKQQIHLNTLIHNAKGHTLSQVIVGIFLGILVGGLLIIVA